MELHDDLSFESISGIYICFFFSIKRLSFMQSCKEETKYQNINNRKLFSGSP